MKKHTMASNMHLTIADGSDEIESEFDYRGALGMLMYLATSSRPDPILRMLLVS